MDLPLPVDWIPINLNIWCTISSHIFSDGVQLILKPMNAQKFACAYTIYQFYSCISEQGAGEW